MRPRVCFRDLMIVMCATIFVDATAVNFDTTDNESYKADQKFVGNFVNAKEKIWQPYWTTSRENRRSIQSSETSNVYRFTEGSVFVSIDKCSRHCIKMDTDRIEDEFEYINLFWSANGTDITDNFLSKHPIVLIRPERNDKHNFDYAYKKCQIYLDLNCNGEVENTTYSPKKVFYPDTQNKEDENSSDISGKMKIVEKYNVTDNTDIKFLVSDRMHRIIMNIYGSISNVILRMPANATVSWPGTTMSWTRMTNTEGVKIDIRNAPSGEWRMKLTGEDNSNYHFIVEGLIKIHHDRTEEKSQFRKLKANETFTERPYYSNLQIHNDATTDNNETPDDLEEINDSDELKTKRQDLKDVITFILDHNVDATREGLSDHRSSDQRKNREAINGNNNSSIFSSDTQLNYSSTDSNINLITSSNSDRKKVSSNEMSSVQKQPEIHARSSIGLTENIDVETIQTGVSNVNVSLKMVEALEDPKLSEELTNYVNENTIEEGKMLIDVNRNSNLLVTPGTIHRIVFDVTNGCILPVRYAYRVKSTPFRIYNIQPTYAWIYPGQMSNVAVDLIIPNNAAPDTANKVTLFIQGTEIKEKSVYLYAQGSLSKLADDVKPTIEYSFNNNCAGKLEKDRCYKSRWSVDIKIRDYESGLKHVISTPNKVYPHNEFISGTKSLISFYYSATCCDTTAKITAIDLLDNYNTYTIDVTVWNNLSEAEIAAITVGALLAIALIVVLLILIIYCVKRRKSHDLPYTQRYGSRPPAERTNF